MGQLLKKGILLTSLFEDPSRNSCSSMEKLNLGLFWELDKQEVFVCLTKAIIPVKASKDILWKW